MPQFVDVPGKGRVEFPDGMSDEAIASAIDEMTGGGAPARKDESLWTKVIAGALEPNATLLSGSVAAPVAGLFGLGAATGKALGIPGMKDMDAADVVRRVQGALTYEPGTQAGKDALSAIGTLFAPLEHVANRAGEVATDVSKSPALGAALYTGLNVLPSAIIGVGSKPDARSSIVRALERPSRYFMRNALKPSTKDVATGNAEKAVTTLLNEGVNATEGGGFKLQAKVDDLNQQIASALSNSGAFVGKDAVLRRAGETKNRVRNQVAPQDDMAAVQRVADSFAQHPDLPRNAIPVAQAQKLKQGTYRQLRDKYGEQGAADVEAQKALARGLKEEIVNEVPELGPLNARESEILNALKMVEHRAAVDANKNPVGLMPLTPNTARASLFLADRSALIKSLLARALNPGKGLNISDEMAFAAVAPQSFNADLERRQEIIDALMNRR